MAKVNLPKVKKPNLSNVRLPRFRSLNKWTILALLSYLNILVFVPLLLSKKNDFVAYHAKQGFVLFLFTAVGLFSFYLPLIPWFVSLFVVFCILFGLYNVLTSREKALPLIGRL